MESEATLNAGDICFDCQQIGVEKHLRYFKINLNGDTILKCESNQCMYPYNDELSSSDDDLPSSNDEDKSLDDVSQTNSLKLINDLIKQFDNEMQDTVSQVPTGESVSEQVAQFDITFFDNFHAGDNENMYKTEIIQDKKQYFPLHETTPIKYDGFISDKTSNDNKSSQHFQQPELNSSDTTLENPYVSQEMQSGEALETKNPCVAYEMHTSNNTIDVKEKIKIQSVEALENKHPCVAYEMHAHYNTIDVKEKVKIQSVEALENKSTLYHGLPTTSNKLRKTIENLTSNLNTALTAEDQQTNISKSVNIEQNQKGAESQRKVLNSSPAPLLDATKKPAKPEKPQTFDVPKANILKVNAILKKFATIEENVQFPQYNRKYKTGQKKDSSKPKAKIKKSNLPEPPSLNTDQNYSLDKIAQIVLTKKLN